ncbi:MAG: 50S ribosomal protein L19e [Candidatus Micrarchaeota archaeon]
MTIATVRRLAADIFNVGENKVKISPDGLKEAEGALTRSDVRGLIDKGIITKAKKQGRASTGRTGRTGHGRRRGTPLDSKAVWMQKIRAQRRFLNMLLDTNVLKNEARRSIYGKVKSGIFRNKKAMLLYLKEAGLVAQSFEPVKAEYKKPEPKPKKQKPQKADVKAAAGKAQSAPRSEAKAEQNREAPKTVGNETHAKGQEHSKHVKGEQR